MTEKLSGNAYWQVDVKTPKGTVRCVVFLHVGAVESDLANPSGHLPMTGKITRQDIPADQRERFLASTCAKKTVCLFARVDLDSLPAPMIQVEGRGSQTMVEDSVSVF